MSMEQRHTQIKEGAGRDEARLNQEFIEALTKWGPYVLFAVAAVVGVYFLYNQRVTARAMALDDAFVAYNEAAKAGNPVGLAKTADEHAGAGAAALMAKTDAADIHLNAFRTGVPTDAQKAVDDTGKLPEGTTLLTDEQRLSELKTAETQYQQVVDATSGNPRQVVLTLGALHGLAAVAESRGDLDKAKAVYQQVIDKARQAGFDGLVNVAQKRIDTLPKLAQAPKLIAQAELPGQPAASDQPFIMSGGMVGRTADGQEIPLGGAPTITGPDGKPLQLQQMPPGFTPPGMNPDGTKQAEPDAAAPAPAPAPAPAEDPKNP